MNRLFPSSPFRFDPADKSVTLIRVDLTELAESREEAWRLHSQANITAQANTSVLPLVINREVP
jgi:hypothetical protein